MGISDEIDVETTAIDETTLLDSHSHYDQRCHTK